MMQALAQRGLASRRDGDPAVGAARTTAPTSIAIVISATSRCSDGRHRHGWSPGTARSAAAVPAKAASRY